MNHPGLASARITVSVVMALACALALIGAVHAQSAGLLAHDINGFALDMTLEQVKAAAAVPFTPLAEGQYKATVEGIDYNFGFSAQGHLYRIDSKQLLGMFAADAGLAAALTARLTQKFGSPLDNQLPAGPAFWRFDEPYTTLAGKQSRRETESLLFALSGGNGQPLAAEMQLQDLRILRRDELKSGSPGTQKP